MAKWIKASDDLPEEGVLCLVYFPVGYDVFTEKTVGPIATAYYREHGGWIYADTPIPLRFEPYYWSELDKEVLEQCKL